MRIIFLFKIFESQIISVNCGISINKYYTLGKWKIYENKYNTNTNMWMYCGLVAVQSALPADLLTQLI